MTPHTLKLDYVDGRGERLVTAENSRHCDRHRGDDGSAHPVRRPADHHERRHPAPGPAAADAGGRRRGRGRLRVRQHVRGAGRSGHADRSAAAAAAVRRPEIVDTLPTTCARTASRCGWTKRSAASSRSATSMATASRSTWPAASRSSPKRRCTASAVPATPPSSISTAAGLPADDRGPLKVNEHYQTEVPQHLRSRRRDRVPEPRLHLDGAGPARRLPRLPRQAKAVPELFPYGIYTIPGDLHGRQDRRGTDASRRSV